MSPERHKDLVLALPAAENGLHLANFLQVFACGSVKMPGAALYSEGGVDLLLWAVRSRLSAKSGQVF